MKKEYLSTLKWVQKNIDSEIEFILADGDPRPRTKKLDKKSKKSKNKSS